MSSPNIRIEFFGVPVDSLDMDSTVDRCEHLIRSSSPAQHVVVNASKILLCQKDVRLRQIINDCPIVNADGQSIVWAARCHGFRLPERVAGIDLMERLWELAASRGYTVYLLGATAEVVRRVEQTARARGIQVVGARDGYWNPSQEAAVVEEIATARPDILFVALPSPRKEYFLAENLNSLGASLSVGVGGSFDVFAGLTRRAPIMWQSAGFEWLYRLLQEPRRLGRRYLVGNSRFLWLVLSSVVRRKHGEAAVFESTSSRGKQ